LVDDDTVEVNTGETPVFDRLSTVCDVQRIYDGGAIYATPLTTMAVSLAQRKADTGSPYAGNGDDVITESEFISALEVARNQVRLRGGYLYRAAHAHLRNGHDPGADRCGGVSPGH